MPTLNQLLKSYTAHGVTFEHTASGIGKTYGNPYQVFKASGSSVNSLTEPHITIWAHSTGRITTVEFTWGGSYHVQCNINWGNGRISAPFLPGSEAKNAAKLQELLIGFLTTSQILGASASITRAFEKPTEEAASTPLTMPKFTLEEFPPLGK